MVISHVSVPLFPKLAALVREPVAPYIGLHLNHNDKQQPGSSIRARNIMDTAYVCVLNLRPITLRIDYKF
jgi:hypothetical protein